MFKPISREYQNKKNNFFSHCADEIVRIYENYPDNSVSPALWDQLHEKHNGLNSYEKKLLMMRANEDLLLYLLKHYYPNSSFNFYGFDTASNYDEAITDEILPLLVQSIKGSISNG